MVTWMPANMPSAATTPTWWLPAVLNVRCGESVRDTPSATDAAAASYATLPASPAVTSWKFGELWKPMVAAETCAPTAWLMPVFGGEIVSPERSTTALGGVSGL